ncbi:hypothetical protein DNTS_005154 [Danionella cerebrum]|uniref:Zinc finger CCCH domain-containing protein 14 n=1 Tax=Danionella cerebrum TaxID=2873325 RepID=A0A553QEX2_9TELE|nr:hypothetical protein DNTS_005154 [Danionella translucida]
MLTVFVLDEELPDYIMVMVANKKNPQQMADDLSLFLGNNTIKFTVWLHGVLEKLRLVAVEPTSLRSSNIHSESISAAEISRRGAEPRGLSVTSSHPDKAEGRVSSSAHENSYSRKGPSENLSRLTSAVRPLMEASAEAVIDIKPDLDDDLIGYEHSFALGPTKGSHSRSTVERTRPAVETLRRTGDTHRSSDASRAHERGHRSSVESRELSRKRKAPVASSVVRVHRGYEHESDLEEDEDEDEGYGLASKVSLPSKPERKPTLPPAKQANKNLILKAITEAQESINKATAYTASQRQMVPVAPRTRSDEMNNAAMLLAQEHMHAFTPQPQHTLQNPMQSRSLSSRLQLEHPEMESREEPRAYELPVLEAARLKALDTRSFITRQPEQPPPIRSRLSAVNQIAEEPPSASRMVQASPLANRSDQEMEECNVTPDLRENNRAKSGIQLHLDSSLNSDAELDAVEDMDVELVQVKRQKLSERCRFWPTCKSGDECPYHHPNTKCKLFPHCKFADKCLFIHPNCKFDAKCTKADCPFTHVSRRLGSLPTRAAPVSSVCRFFPDCTKMECPFYHPKPCRFAALCKRAGCTFYHPSAAVPPRSALKWTKTQSRYQRPLGHRCIHILNCLLNIFPPPQLRNIRGKIRKELQCRLNFL